MHSKLLFFDIDGTLVNFQTQMPDSAKTALRKAQKNGHKIFLCTGRGKAQIYPFLLDFGFDGIIAAAGAYIEYENKVLFHKVFGQGRIRKIVELFTEYDISFMLQMTEGCVLTRRNMVRFVESLGFDVTEEQADLIKTILERSLGRVVLDEDINAFPEKYPNTENLLYSNSPLSREEIQKRLGDDLKVVPPSFNKPKSDQGEITINGMEKSLAIRKTAELVGADMADTIAFGDGANDVDMIKTAGVGVAMGNAIPEAREAADFVTKDIDDDGIEYAMRELGLI